VGAKGAAAPPADEGGLESLLSEPMHVEFAEEDTDKHVVRPVRTRGNVDITKELEKLRTVPAPEATRPPASARDRDVDKLFQDLVSDKESRQDVKRKAAVDVPARLLKGMSDVRIHLAFTHEGKQEVVEDAVVIKVMGTKRLERLTLHLDLELKAKG
jgi:hypothetical protein